MIKNYLKVAAMMFAVFVILAFGLFLSGCAVAMPQDEKPATWEPSTHVTGAEVLRYDSNHNIYGLYENVYVYECDPNNARIEPNGVFRSGRWIERHRLRPDVCLAEQP